MLVALLYNARPDHLFVSGDATDDRFEEFDSPETIAAIEGALRDLGVGVEPVEADRTMLRRLEEGGFDFAFNIAEGSGRRCREAIVPAVCELLGLPYTGSDALTMAATLDKEVARRVVSPDVPVAPAVLLDRGFSACDLQGLRWPVIVKPNDEGSSKGIREDAVVENAAEAIGLARRLRALYDCPVLVEEFLSGPELTVGVVGNGASREVIGIMEIAPVGADVRFVYSIEVKRDYRRRVTYHVPPRLPAATVEAVRGYALRAWSLLGCRDFARFDFRLDGDGWPYFLECNPLPGLDPVNSDLVILSRARMSHRQLVQRIFLAAQARTGMRLA
jgi:D-alanine-D-alanine ligase